MRDESEIIVDQKTYYRFLGVVDKTDSCWFWKASKGHNGYGQFSYNKKRYVAHRFSYLIFKGKIPKNFQLDHICRNRSCVNPDHLEPVTCGENLLRSPWTLNSIQSAKTHCINGHEFSETNTYVTGKRKRNCRVCSRERAQKCRQKKKATPSVL